MDGERDGWMVRRTGEYFLWSYFAFHLYFVTIVSLHILDAIMSCTMFILF